MANEYKVSSVQVEVLRAGATAVPAKVSQTNVEVLRRGPVAVPAKVSSTYVEVLRTIAVSTAVVRRRIPMVHVLM